MERIHETIEEIHVRDPNLHLEQVLEELDHAKEELRMLKLDISSALEAKKNAEKEHDASESKAMTCSSFVELINNEIRETNEEQMLVEFARFEAEREVVEIETKRAVEAARFVRRLDETRRKIRLLQKEIELSKDLEKKLVETTSDLNILQNEMELIRAMEGNIQTNQAGLLSQAAEAELEAAKEELASHTNKGFKLMASIDLVRGEMASMAVELKRLKKLEKDAEHAVQYLSNKLLKTTSKLESALAADERAQVIIFNLSTALQHVQTDIEEAKNEAELLCQERIAIEFESEEINLGMDLTQTRLQAAMEELEVAKASEAFALARLKSVSERQMRTRTRLLQRGSTITISKFEYEYLRRRGEAAQGIADKKTAAAQAWIEAIEAGEKEISLKIEIAQRETMNLRDVEEGEELNNKKHNEEVETFDLHLRVGKRLSLKGVNGLPGESRRIKTRRSSASSARRRSITRSPTFNVKKRKKVMTHLVRFFKGRKTGNLN